MSVTLEHLEFDNRFADSLPADPVSTNTRRQVANACYSRVQPTPVSNPTVIAWAKEVAELIGLAPDSMESKLAAQVFGGNRVLEGMNPYAMCYGGHQFGNWAGQLGDGRAINLGTVKEANGPGYTLQLKGAGPTPYSRTADGLAVLRSSIREFVCSEAMYHLGVPTTRALSLALTGEEVLRDMFYDGNPAFEPGAVVCRVAPSFIRFGNFQIFAAQGDVQNLKRLADFTIRNYFPHLVVDGSITKETYVEWFKNVCELTCDMIVHWMRVGFVHGVMNTDNMSILGLTIDYGPYGWLEGYDPGWTPNTTDAHGKRYRFGNQPLVAHWNLYQLGNALLPLVGEPQTLQQGLDGYLAKIETQANRMMASKLGFNEWRDEDQQLKEALYDALVVEEIDMTIFYRKLSSLPCTAEGSDDHDLLSTILPAFYFPDKIAGATQGIWREWLASYRARVRLDGVDDQQRLVAMNRVNPKYVFRNYLAQIAIDQSTAGDHSKIHELLEVLRRPYDEQPEFEEYAAKRPEWARTRAGCSMLSCSS